VTGAARAARSGISKVPAVLVAVFDDIAVGAWTVTNAIHQAEIPEGKTRMVSRSTFETAAEN
jgi:hypothetical protein